VKNNHPALANHDMNMKKKKCMRCGRTINRIVNLGESDCGDANNQLPRTAAQYQLTTAGQEAVVRLLDTAVKAFNAHVKRFHGTDRDDAFSEAMLALVDAVARYDPSYGTEIEAHVYRRVEFHLKAWSWRLPRCGDKRMRFRPDTVQVDTDIHPGGFYLRVEGIVPAADVEAGHDHAPEIEARDYADWLVSLDVRSDGAARMKFLDGRDNQAIGKNLGIHPSTASDHVWDSVRRIRAALEEKGVGCANP
jgi:DNA-directed RNA polymerase specialized sigma24 family protein